MAAKVKKPSNIDDDFDDDLEVTEISGKQKKPPKPPREKKPREEKEPKQKKIKREKKGGNKIVPILVVLFFVVGISALLFFNVLGVRSKYIAPLLQNVPIVKNLVPAPQTGDTLAGLTQQQLVAKVEQMQRQIDDLLKANKELEDRKRVDSEELGRLQELVAAQEQYTQDKALFDRMIAENDPNAYVNFYASISPANQETLYDEAVAKVQYSKDFKKYIATVQAVDEAEAAKILTELVKTDMDLVVLILTNLDSERSGTIIANMEAKVAASVVKRMVPEQQ